VVRQVEGSSASSPGKVNLPAKNTNQGRYEGEVSWVDHEACHNCQAGAIVREICDADCHAGMQQRNVERDASVFCPS
jgi:hypothetical protein